MLRAIAWRIEFRRRETFRRVYCLRAGSRSTVDNNPYRKEHMRNCKPSAPDPTSPTKPTNWHFHSDRVAAGKRAVVATVTTSVVFEHLVSNNKPLCPSASDESSFRALFPERTRQERLL